MTVPNKSPSAGSPMGFPGRQHLPCAVLFIAPEGHLCVPCDSVGKALGSPPGSSLDMRLSLGLVLLSVLSRSLIIAVSMTGCSIPVDH